MGRPHRGSRGRLNTPSVGRLGKLSEVNIVHNVPEPTERRVAAKRQMMHRLDRNIDIRDLKERLRRELPRLREEYAVRGLGLFGSYVRGEQKRGSDVDVVVEFSEVPGMFRFLELQRELSRLLQLPVDLVQKETLKPAIGKRILDEVQRV